MPILAVNQFGQVYETSPDREDGLGIKDYPSEIQQQDCTLGQAYLKSEAAQRDFVMRERQSRKLEQAKDEARRAEAHRRYASQKRQEAKMGNILNQPDIIQHQLKKALQMGCACDYTQGVNGNVMSANGKIGYQGMSRDQQTIHYALNPTKYGTNPAHSVDPEEQRQYEQRMGAYRMLYARSRGPVR